jgi:hypothetical protein
MQKTYENLTNLIEIEETKILEHKSQIEFLHIKLNKYRSNKLLPCIVCNFKHKLKTLDIQMQHGYTSGYGYEDSKDWFDSDYFKCSSCGFVNRLLFLHDKKLEEKYKEIYHPTWKNFYNKFPIFKSIKSTYDYYQYKNYEPYKDKLNFNSRLYNNSYLEKNIEYFLK